jgi:hypothetical protein
MCMVDERNIANLASSCGDTAIIHKCWKYIKLYISDHVAPVEFERAKERYKRGHGGAVKAFSGKKRVVLKI